MALYQCSLAESFVDTMGSPPVEALYHASSTRNLSLRSLTEASGRATDKKFQHSDTLLQPALEQPHHCIGQC